MDQNNGELEDALYDLAKSDAMADMVEMYGDLVNDYADEKYTATERAAQFINALNVENGLGALRDKIHGDELR